MIKACLKKKKQAQEKLFHLFSPMVKGICLRYAGNEMEAEDDLQDTFVRVFEKLQDFKSEGALGGWIRKIAVNTSLENLRKRNKANWSDSDFIPEDVDISIFKEIELEYLMEKIKRLAPGFRIVFNLYAVEGFNHKEIAKKLDISEGTSKSQYSRAKAELRKMIEQDEVKNLNYAG